MKRIKCTKVRMCMRDVMDCPDCTATATFAYFILIVIELHSSEWGERAMAIRSKVKIPREYGANGMPCGEWRWGDAQNAPRTYTTNKCETWSSFARMLCALVCRQFSFEIILRMHRRCLLAAARHCKMEFWFYFVWPKNDKDEDKGKWCCGRDRGAGQPVRSMHANKYIYIYGFLNWDDHDDNGPYLSSLCLCLCLCVS